MNRLFEKYGVNKMNLAYNFDEERYETNDLEGYRMTWYLELREAMVRASENGLVYFNESAKEKVAVYVNYPMLKQLGFLLHRWILVKDIRRNLCRGTILHRTLSSLFQRD